MNEAFTSYSWKDWGKKLGGRALIGFLFSSSSPWLILLVPVVFGYPLVAHCIIAYRLKHEGQLALGTIQALWREAGNYYIAFRFAEGLLTRQAIDSDTWRLLKAGDKLNVTYLPSAPQHCRAEIPSHWYVPPTITQGATA